MSDSDPRNGQRTSSTTDSQHHSPYTTTENQTMPSRLPPSATQLIDQSADRLSPIEDDDPEAALELIRDAIVLFEKDTQATALQRGSYEVIITKAPENWRESADYAVHLDYVTDHIAPDPNEPGVSARGATNLWSESLQTVREIVRDHFGRGVFEQFTQDEEEEC